MYQFVDKSLKCFQTQTAKSRYLKLQQTMNLFKEVSNQFLFQNQMFGSKFMTMSSEIQQIQGNKSNVHGNENNVHPSERKIIKYNKAA